MYEINFEKELQIYSDYSCSLTGKEKCYEGEYHLNSKYYYSNNCSKACMNNLKECFYKYQKCDYFKCNNYSWEVSNSLCKYNNRITKWRNTQKLKYRNIYDIKPYNQIKPKNELCPSGYIKCGIINSNKDILCLNEDIFDFKCPINDIIISRNDNPPEGNYKRFQMGDKFIFYTNEKTDNYIITDLFINFDTDRNNYNNTTQIDYDTFSNFSSFNNIHLGANQKIPLTAFLNVIQFRKNYTYQEMIKSKEHYEKMNEIYPNKKISEMNAKKNKKLLPKLYGFAFNFLAFVLIPIFQTSGKYNCDNKCDFCEDIARNIIVFYIILLPYIVLNLFCFIIIILVLINI